jgi:catechol 2,3-dioxygenase-like lactoylglutathione lyase family enzyme
MLADRRVHTTLPTGDVDALRPFYEDVLGLTPYAILPGAVIYEVGDGTRFAISRSGIPAAGSHTQMAFAVPDVDAEVAALRARGITFETYETPATDAAGIARIGPGRAAWFKDPAGNLLAVIQFDDLA